MSGEQVDRRTTIGRVRGLGTAHGGTAHWWAQRLTAMALVPLGLWFAASMVLLAGCSYAQAVAWLGSPLPAVLMILLVVASFHHGQLGLQVVIEDYVHGEAAKLVLLVLIKFAAVALALGAIFAVLKAAFGG